MASSILCAEVTEMHTPNRSLAILGAALLAASQAAYAQGNLAQTIDLSQWGGTPVAIVQPPVPAPAPCCSLTSIAFNPSNHTLYVADYATTNVYAIDTEIGRASCRERV